MLTAQEQSYTCKVCGQSFHDTWDHVMSNVTGWSAYKDVEHASFAHMIELGIEPDTCFCGGEVTTVGVGDQGWDRSCRQCGFLYDED